MRTSALVALGLLGATLVAVACGSSDAKQAVRAGDAGASGEGGAATSAGGGEAPPSGAPGAGMPGGGAPAEPAGGVGGGAEPSGGVSAGPSGGAGGDSGVAPISLATLAGKWSGSLLNTYTCESSVQAFEFTIEGSSVISTGWPYQLDASATIAQQQGQAFTIDVAYPEQDAYTPAGTLHGQFFVDASAEHALLVFQDLESPDGPKEGNIAIMQKGDTVTPALTNADLLGTWAGTGAHFDSNFGVSDTFASGATFTADAEAVLLAGEDVDGAFSSEDAGRYYEEPAAIASQVTQGDAHYAAVFLLSGDKRALAFALLNAGDLTDPYYTVTCSQQVFADLSIHKFGLWTKAE